MNIIDFIANIAINSDINIIDGNTNNTVNYANNVIETESETETKTGNADNGTSPSIKERAIKQEVAPTPTSTTTTLIQIFHQCSIEATYLVVSIANRNGNAVPQFQINVVITPLRREAVTFFSMHFSVFLLNVKRCVFL